MPIYMQVQVKFSQGLVKLFLVPPETTCSDFVQVVSAFGRHRSIRYLPDVDAAAAELLVSTGNATKMEVRRAA